MTPSRTAGILLHPSSLPGRFGTGDLGPAARAFVDFLAGAGQSLWQVLPLTPPGYGNSPYQSPSAFAGNVRLLSPEWLRDQGLLAAADLAEVPAFSEGVVDEGGADALKRALLEKAQATFEAAAPARERRALADFCAAEAGWLEDYALFAAVKDAHGGRAWTDWEPDIRARRPRALEDWSLRLAREVRRARLGQYLFFRQWAELRAHAHARGVRIMGDIPIFVAHDSADVWAHPEEFSLDAQGRPTVQAGVPPDYFSATGQCWGNPLYRWDRMAATGFRWWVERFRSALRLVDLVRVDHFRGFESYWEIPGDEQTAVHGRWVQAPGEALFRKLRQELGEMPIVAENLGLITPEVENLRRAFGLPGMAVLQFAFDPGSEGDVNRPHNHERDLVVYTGTHDNDTTVGWWNGNGGTTRAAEERERERAFFREYLATDGREAQWDLIRAAYASVARVAVVPLQDVLGLGSEARMNQPGRAAGNWGWRFREGDLAPDLQVRLLRLARTYGRAPAGPAAPEEEGK